MPTPPPRLKTPPDSGEFASMPLAGDTGEVPNQVEPSEQPTADPGALQDARDILMITASARKLANKYPSAVPEVQTINDAVQKLQMKIMMVQPPAEVAAPPQ